LQFANITSTSILFHTSVATTLYLLVVQLFSFVGGMNLLLRCILLVIKTRYYNSSYYHHIIKELLGCFMIYRIFLCHSTVIHAGNVQKMFIFVALLLV